MDNIEKASDDLESLTKIMGNATLTEDHKMKKCVEWFANHANTGMACIELAKRVLQTAMEGGFTEYSSPDDSCGFFECPGCHEGERYGLTVNGHGKNCPLNYLYQKKLDYIESLKKNA